MALLQTAVHALQKVQRRAVDAAVRVALPVDEPGHRVHAQAVGVEHPQPVIGAGLDEALDLTAGVHKVTAAPLALAHSGCRVLIQRCTVKFFQAVGVHGKVNRYKIQNNADALLVAGVDKFGQLVRAVAAGGGKKAGDLVAPAAVEGVLGQGHEFNVGEAVLLAVGGQQLGQLGVGVPAAVLLLPPAAGMDLVDIQRFIEAFCAFLHPLVVVKALRAVSHNAAAVGAQCHSRAVGVAVGHALAVCAAHPILVDHTRVHTGGVAFPHGGLGAMQVKGADLGLDSDMLRGRCPHCKMCAAEIGMRPEKVIRIKGVPGVKILHIHDESLLL